MYLECEAWCSQCNHDYTRRLRSICLIQFPIFSRGSHFDNRRILKSRGAQDWRSLDRSFPLCWTDRRCSTILHCPSLWVSSQSSWHVQYRFTIEARLWIMALWWLAFRCWFTHWYGRGRQGCIAPESVWWICPLQCLVPVEDVVIEISVTLRSEPNAFLYREKLLLIYDFYLLEKAGDTSKFAIRE